MLLPVEDRAPAPTVTEAGPKSFVFAVKLTDVPTQTPVETEDVAFTTGKELITTETFDNAVQPPSTAVKL